VRCRLVHQYFSFAHEPQIVHCVSLQYDDAERNERLTCRLRVREMQSKPAAQQLRCAHALRLRVRSVGSCEPGFYVAPRATSCVACPVGFTCNGYGVNVTIAAVATGFWRPSASSVLAKRCPYPPACLGGVTPTRAYDQTSGSLCAPGLAGAYCQLCDSTRIFVASRVHCEACATPRNKALLLIALLFIGALALCGTRRLWTQPCARRARALLLWFTRVSMRTKLKILIGFYQVLTALPAVYSVSYPPSYARVLNVFRVVNLHLFGWLPGLHPTCFGLSSLLSQLVAATLAPLGAVVVLVTICELRSERSRAMPWVLYLAFLVHPSVSSFGFRAIAPCDCFEQANGGELCFLREDYAVECVKGAHPRAVTAAAWVTIICYALGVPLLFASVLGCGTYGTAAADFLASEYKRGARWWSLMEVGKKVLLTGFLALVRPGSLSQLYMAVAASLVVSALQLHIAPYRLNADNLLAMLSDTSLTFTLLGTLALKTWTLDPGQDGSTITIVVVVLTFAAVFIAIVATGMLMYDVRKPRFVCYTDTMEPVRLPVLQSGAFHIFLSHVWSTGQDQMRIVKQRLLECTMFDMCVFLVCGRISTPRLLCCRQACGPWIESLPGH
jgi:hypothetical protein